MSEFAIQARGLSKLYHLGAQQARYRTIRETIVDAARLPIRQIRSVFTHSSKEYRIQKNTMWALKDISFDIHRGEAVGVIGRNGAGKSTLLKILSQITEPTEGSADVYGRIGSLLEVGTGFHPELTGRENIYLNGAILGMKRLEIERKFDEIVDFAEVEKFLDTPVKHFSSGMYLRLAFAVAAHLEPEILLVDEVLAVGDAQFQKKCLGKMGDVAKQGRTVLFVSHNMAAIENLCQQVIWLHNGQFQEMGDADQVISNYLKSNESNQTECLWNDIQTAPGNDQVRLHRVSVKPEFGPVSEPITIRTPFVMEFEYWNLKQEARLSLSLHLINEQGIIVFNTFPIHEPNWHGRPFPIGLYKSKCYVPGDMLNSGMHRVLMLVVKDQSIVIFRLEDALIFDVQDSPERRNEWHGKWVGAVRPDLRWSTELIEQL